MKFAHLLVGHRPSDPAEATLTLAALAALSGLRCDGDPMPDAHPRTPSLREIAAEIGLHVGAVRRGVAHLIKVGAVTLADGELRVDPVGLRERWAEHRCRLRITEEARSHGLRAEPLLLVGLVAGQLDQRGRLVLGRRWLAERLGWQVASGRTKGSPSGRLDTALRAAEKAGALHRWTIPGSWQLCLALGPSRTREREASRNREREEAETTDRRETAKPPVAKPQRGGRESAKSASRNRKGYPDPPDSPPDSPPDARPAREATAPPARGDTGPAAAAAAPAPEPATPAPDRDQQRAAVEAFVTGVAKRGIERMDHRHAADVAGLLDEIGPRPAVRDRRAFARERVQFAGQVIRWCPSPERLGRWLTRVSRWFGPANLGGYLRRAVERAGDPGTVLESAAKNTIGRAAELVQDFTPATERALEGEHRIDVARIVEGGAAVLESVDAAERERLREEFAGLLRKGRIVAARTVLLRLVGDPRPSDVALQRAIGDACTLSDARRVLEVA